MMTDKTDPNPMHQPMQKEVDKRGNTIKDVEKSLAGKDTPASKDYYSESDKR